MSNKYVSMHNITRSSINMQKVYVLLTNET